MRRVGPKGRGEFVRISWDEALDRIATRLRRRHRHRRRRGDLALCRHRQHGPAPRRLRRRPTAVERARHLAARADHLHDRRRLRHRLHARPQPRRHGSGNAAQLEAGDRLGRQRAVDASAPVAADPRGPPAGRADRRHRSGADAHRRGVRLASRAVARHRRGAGARPAARRARARAPRIATSSTGTRSAGTRSASASSSTRPMRVAAITGLPAESIVDARPADRPHPAHRHPHRHRPAAPRRRRDGGAHDHLHPRASPATGAMPAAASTTTRAGSSASTGRRCGATTFAPASGAGAAT